MAFAAAKQIAAPVRRSRYNVVGRVYLPPIRQGTRYRIRSLPPPNFYLGDPDSLGTLDFSLKKAFKRVTKAVKKVGKVVLRVVPGTVAGFVTGGPVGAVVGAAASYETVRRKTSGLGSGIQVGGLLKGAAYGVGIGAVSGVAATTFAGALTKVAPSAMASIGYFPGLSTGLLPSVSSAAFSLGGGAVGAVGKVATTAAGLFMSKPTTLPISEQPSQEAPWVELPASAYQNLYRPIGGVAQPQSPYLTDAYAQSGGGEPTSVPASPGYAPSGFVSPEEQIGITQAGLFGIPWSYIGLGVTGVMIIYLLSQSPRPKAVYSRNPRKRRGRR